MLARKAALTCLTAAGGLFAAVCSKTAGADAKPSADGLANYPQPSDFAGADSDTKMKSTSAPKSFTLPIIAKGQGNEVLMNPAILAITAGAAIVIPAVLFLALRSAKRSERIEDFVHSVELYVNKHPAVKQYVGPVYAAGKYDVSEAPSDVSQRP
jgi:hypothetical protein